MLKSLDSLIDGYQKTTDRSKAECSIELENIRSLIRTIVPYFAYATKRGLKIDMPKYVHSLVYCCFLELFSNSGNILFMSCSGLYRNAFDEVRYVLEHAVQSLYIDVGHPKSNIETKIEILREVENKREYRCQSLIDELARARKIHYKKRLQQEYKNLSKKIHPSHKQTIETLVEVLAVSRPEIISSKEVIDCEEISKIYISMKSMYDIFFFLYLIRFPELKKWLKDNKDFIENIKAHNLFLLRKTFTGYDLRKKA